MTDKTKFLETDFPFFVNLPNQYYVVTDGTDKFLRFSENFSKLLGYTVEELAEKPFFTLIHPEDLPKTVSAFAALSSPNSKEEKVSAFLNRYITKDNGIVWMYWSANNADNGLCYSIAQEVTNLLIKRSTNLKLKTKEEIVESLTGTELLLFNSFYASFGKAVSKETLVTSAYEDCHVQDHTINVHLSNLRKKLKGSLFSIKGSGKGKWKMVDISDPLNGKRSMAITDI